MQDWELAQQIGDFIEVANMELGLKLQDEDVDLMPSAPQVTIQTPLAPAIELAPSKEWEIFTLDYDMVMDVYKFSLDEL